MNPGLRRGGAAATAGSGGGGRPAGQAPAEAAANLKASEVHCKANWDQQCWLARACSPRTVASTASTT